MAVLTHVSDELVQDFLQPYGLPPLRALRGIAAGSVNTNYAVTLGATEYFLRIYEEQDAAGAEKEAELLFHLFRQQLPVACPLMSTRGPLGQIVGKPAALFPWLSGSMRCQASVTAHHTREVGRSLASIHLAAAPLATTRSAGRFTRERLLERLPAISKADDGETRSLADWLRRAFDLVEGQRGPLPTSVIHGDLFRDNVLFTSADEITGLLDFESASVGSMTFDIAVTLLAWCFGDGFEADLGTALLSGYESVRPLTTEEREGLWGEASFAALRFLTTRVTDYAMRTTEGPRVMKDWRRFRMRFEFLESVGSTGLRKLVFR